MSLVTLRLLLLLVAAALTAGLIALFTETRFSLSGTALVSALYFIPVNIVCLWLLARLNGARRGNFAGTLLAMAGYRRDRLGTDILQGFLWQLLLFIPFALVIVGLVLLLSGGAPIDTAFETVFVPEGATPPELPRHFMIASALTVALLFPLTNAPAEELVYRYHAQGRLQERGSPLWWSLLLPSLAFGLQHILLAPTAAAAPVYFAAFTVWGLGAALIYGRQGRLMPILIAHFITNFFTGGVPLLVLLLLGLI